MPHNRERSASPQISPTPIDETPGMVRGGRGRRRTRPKVFGCVALLTDESEEHLWCRRGPHGKERPSAGPFEGRLDRWTQICYRHYKIGGSIDNTKKGWRTHIVERDIRTILRTEEAASIFLSLPVQPPAALHINPPGSNHTIFFGP